MPTGANWTGAFSVFTPKKQHQVTLKAPLLSPHPVPSTVTRTDSCSQSTVSLLGTAEKDLQGHHADMAHGVTDCPRSQCLGAALGRWMPHHRFSSHGVCLPEMPNRKPDGADAVTCIPVTLSSSLRALSGSWTRMVTIPKSRAGCRLAPMSSKKTT